MRSLGYAVEAFPSAADFLASRRLHKTACLIADIQMPGMTGVELYARLIEAGHNIPTILPRDAPRRAHRPRREGSNLNGRSKRPHRSYIMETARCEKIGCLWESLDRVTQRPHESPHGPAKEFIVIDDCDQ